jgi:hypothetical protein
MRKRETWKGRVKRDKMEREVSQRKIKRACKRGRKTAAASE